MWTAANSPRRLTLQIRCSTLPYDLIASGSVVQHAHERRPAGRSSAPEARYRQNFQPAARLGKRTVRSLTVAALKDMNRREFMKLSGTAVMAPAPFYTRQPVRWGLQLYTVISLLERDF